MRAADAIDHSVGFTALAGLGAKVGKDAPLAVVHARDEASASPSRKIHPRRLQARRQGAARRQSRLRTHRRVNFAQQSIQLTRDFPAASS